MHPAFIVLLMAALLTSWAATPELSGPTLSIPEIQGVGNTSPLNGQKLSRPLQGCVTGVTAEGFFLQDIAGDRNTATSDGIYVYRYSSWKNPRGLKPGDLLELSTYKVQEFYGQTELSGLPNDKNTTYRALGKCALPPPIPIDAPSAPILDLGKQYERYEGMRVTVDLDASVAGPTTRYASRYPAGDPEVTLAPVDSPFYGRRIFASELPVGRGTLTLTGGLGVDLPALKVLDRVSAPGLTGVLAYQFGRYVLLVDNPAVIKVQLADTQLPSFSPPGPDEWAACTFNVEDLFDAVDDRDGDMGEWAPSNLAAYHANIAEHAALIRERLGGCTVLALQEVEGKDDVWADLAREMGPDYRFDYRESADVRDITVGLIYDATRVELRKSFSAPACSLTDYGVKYEHARGPRADAAPCPQGTYPLYDRPPYVADLIIANAAQDRRLEIRVVVVHLKSKRGDEAENLPRRVQQARHVATLVEDDPGSVPLSMALGDFNDDLGSEPMAELRRYVSLYERHTPGTDRYSYIYNGRAQAVDHVVMTPLLDAYYLNGQPLHVNADYAEPFPGEGGRTSDHDPLVTRFRFEPTGISAALIGAVSGAASAPYHHSLRLK